MNTYTIPKLLDGSSHTVQATFHGQFAIHRDLCNPKVWQVTHRPTGYSTMSGLGTPKQKHARAFARWLMSLPVNWAQTDVTLLTNELKKLDLPSIRGKIREIEAT